MNNFFIPTHIKGDQNPVNSFHEDPFTPQQLKNFKSKAATDEVGTYKFMLMLTCPGDLSE